MNFVVYRFLITIKNWFVSLGIKKAPCLLKEGACQLIGKPYAACGKLMRRPISIFKF